MKNETACGVIPLRKKGESWQILLILHKKGTYWAFPKGHGELGETMRETAVRELQEETGLTVSRYLGENTFSESYSFTRQNVQINKSVTYYLAEVKGTVQLQNNEVIDYIWLPIEQVSDKITFPESKRLVEKVLSSLNNFK